MNDYFNGEWFSITEEDIRALAPELEIRGLRISELPNPIHLNKK